VEVKVGRRLVCAEVPKLLGANRHLGLKQEKIKNIPIDLFFKEEYIKSVNKNYAKKFKKGSMGGRKVNRENQKDESRRKNHD
jgi:hypothetical protein